MQQKVLEKLRKITGKKFVKLTNNGNSAILCAMYMANKSKVLIPDQGGWLTYSSYAEILGLKVVEVKTDFGVIDLDDLKRKVDGDCCLILTNPAGYFAEQPIKEIAKVCKNRCLFILDITGSVGDKYFYGCEDILVSSFGRWKPVNLGYGGMIATGNKTLFERGRAIFGVNNFQGCSELMEKLGELPKRLRFLYNKNKTIKNDLKGFDVVHRGRKGINVIVGFNSEQEKKKIIKYCEENKLEYTLCPRYIRVNKDAISIEVKRLG